MRTELAVSESVFQALHGTVDVIVGRFVYRIVYRALAREVFRAVDHDAFNHRGNTVPPPAVLEHYLVAVV
jgi:hypothetical protein